MSMSFESRRTGAADARATALAAFVLISVVGGTAVFLLAREKEPPVQASATASAAALPADPEKALHAALASFDPAGKVRTLEHDNELAVKGPDSQRNSDIVRRKWTARLDTDARTARLDEAMARGKATRADYRGLRDLETLASVASAVKVNWTPPAITYPTTFRPVSVKDLKPIRTYGVTVGETRLATAAAASAFLARKLGAFEELHVNDMGLMRPPPGKPSADGTVRLEWTTPEPVAFPKCAEGESPVLEVVLAAPLPRLTWLEVRLSPDGKTWRDPIVFTRAAGAQLAHLLEPADLDGAKYVDVQLARVTQANARLDSARLQGVFVHAVDAAAAAKLAAP